VQERGELITEICDSLNKSRQWLYKWLRREDEVTTDSPYRAHNQTPSEIEQAVINARQRLEETRYAQIGVNAINQKLYTQGIAPLPASTINRILARAGLQQKKEIPLYT